MAARVGAKVSRCSHGSAAQTIKPTELDIILARKQFANAQRKADQAYADQNVEADPETC